MTDRLRTLLVLRRVQGPSMEPALRSGAIVLAVPARRFKVGQVVIFRHNGLEKIKRITQLRPNQLYVVGDNREASTDSRTFGWIDSKLVVGRVVWPRHISRL